MKILHCLTLKLSTAALLLSCNLCFAQYNQSNEWQRQAAEEKRLREQEERISQLEYERKLQQQEMERQRIAQQNETALNMRQLNEQKARTDFAVKGNVFTNIENNLSYLELKVGLGLKLDESELKWLLGMGKFAKGMGPAFKQYLPRMKGIYDANGRLQ